MDRNTSGERIMSTYFLILIVFGIWLRPVSSYALTPEHSSERSSLPELREKINMEEMKIHGDVRKPHIMYIIPRAKLDLDPIMYDGYFLPPSPESPGDRSLTRRGPAAHRETAPLVPARYHRQANSPEVKAGSCISCHYPGMVIPRGHHTQSLVKELNQLCLQCHHSRFYFLNREVIEEMNTFLKGQELSPSSEPPYPKEISLNSALCKKCHATWTPKAEVYTHQADSPSPWPKEFDTDTFCKVCHRSHVY
jgi:hypothetical protein